MDGSFSIHKAILGNFVKRISIEIPYHFVGNDIRQFE
jgi:hypothetical protein